MALLFGIAGSPVDKSLSPILHNALMSRFKIRGEFLRFDSNEIANLYIRGNDALTGLSVTTPLKEQAYKLASTHDEISTLTKACNTLVFNDNVIAGYNTDGPSILDILSSYGSEVNGLKVSILGGGPTARAIAAALASAGAKTRILVRHPEKLDSVWSNPPAIVSEINSSTTTDLLVNATTVTNPEHSRQLENAVTKANANILISVHYQQSDGLLIQESKKTGAMYISGLEMFIFQALRQFEIWHGERPCYDDAVEVLSHYFPALFKADGKPAT